MTIRSLCWCTVLVLLLAPISLGAEPPADEGSGQATGDESLGAQMQCSIRTTRMDKYQYLRALSLDLRGIVPTPEEYRRLEGRDDVPESLIDEWLRSEAFGDRVVRWHRKLLWNNLDNVQFWGNRARIRQYEIQADDRTTHQVFYGRPRARRVRGKQISCGPERAEFDDDGELILEEKQPDGSWEVDTDGSCQDPTREQPCREGWIEVDPYWSSDGDKVKVCALDAGVREYEPAGAECTGGQYECGCGEHLRECVTPSWRGPETRDVFKEAMADQVEKLVRKIVLEDRPYIDLFRTNEAFFNGPLVHYWTYHADNARRLDTVPNPYDQERLPDLEFTDRDTWREVTLGEEHAGVLTSPAYLLRFSRNRQRANHFYKKFLCEPFEPPEGGLEIDTSGEEVEPDLQKRSGCQYCHSRLEPAAAHWGRWRETGAGYLDPETHPAYDPACEECATSSKDCSERCEAHYITDLTDRYKQLYAGKLDAYLFRRKRHEPNVEVGPERLAMQTVGDNRLPRCAVETRAEALLGRPLGVADEPWVTDLVDRFVESGYSYREMVKAIVTSSKYRRVR